MTLTTPVIVPKMIQTRKVVNRFSKNQRFNIEEPRTVPRAVSLKTGWGF